MGTTFHPTFEPFIFSKTISRWWKRKTICTILKEIPFCVSLISVSLMSALYNQLNTTRSVIGLPECRRTADVIEKLLSLFCPTWRSFENVCEILPDWASEGIEECLVGAVYEQEKEKKRDEKYSWDLKNTWTETNLRTLDLLQGKFVIFLVLLFCSLYKTHRFHFTVCLFSYRSQKTSNCGKNISDTLACGSYATFLFL